MTFVQEAAALAAARRLLVAAATYHVVEAACERSASRARGNPQLAKAYTPYVTHKVAGLGKTYVDFPLFRLADFVGRVVCPRLLTLNARAPV